MRYINIKHFFYKLKNNICDIFLYKDINGNNISYFNYWNSRPGILNGFKKNRADILIKYIKLHDLNHVKYNILDIGSGLGDIQKYAKKFLNCTFILSENSNDACVQLGKENKENFNVINLNILDHTDYSIYNVITCFEVLEHIPTPEIFIQNFLKFKGKHLLFSVPNSGYWIYRLRFLFGKFPVQWKQHPGEHVRFWTYSDMIWWLKQMKVTKYEIFLYDDKSIQKYLLSSLFYKGIFVIIKT